MLAIPEVFQPRPQQRLFRLLLDAMARPGRVADLGPWLDDAPAALGIIATLVDTTARFADPDHWLTPAQRRWLASPEVPVAEADFIAVDGRRPPPADFAPRLGTLTAPEQGATLIVIVDDLMAAAPRHHLTGPGIDGSRTTSLGDLHLAWLQRRATWVKFFPLGVDLFVCDRHRAVALPRTAVLTPGKIPP
ncbi:MAG: phosphonate C-P lyase system protein PhnH [Candidatus Competibacterales bacterium]